jgi:hypothetical protein
MKLKVLLSAIIAMAVVVLLSFIVRHQRDEPRGGQGSPGGSVHLRGNPEGALAEVDAGSPSAQRETLDARQGSASAGDDVGAEGASRLRVVGTVTDVEGLLVEGAKVFLGADVADGPMTLDSLAFDPTELVSTTTSIEGRFAGEVERGSTLSLAVRARGHAPLDRVVELRGSAAELDLGRLVLEPGVDLAGRVVDPAGVGRPDVRLIRVIGAPGFQEAGLRESLAGRTNTDGTFAIGGFPVGSWELRVECDGFPPITATGERHEAGTEDGLHFQLREGVWGRGSVEAPAGIDLGIVEVKAGIAKEQPRHPGIPPSAYYSSGLCSDSGVFEVGPFQPELKGSLFSFQAHLRRGTGRIPLSPEVAGRLGEGAVVLRVPSLSSVHFNLEAERNGAPVEDAEVSAILWESGAQRTLDVSAAEMVVQPERGRYVVHLQTISGTADVELTLRAEGYHELRIGGIRVEAGAQLDLGSRVLVARSMAHVVVVDETSGDPLAGARVIAASADALRSQTDQGGSSGSSDGSLRESRVTNAVGRVSIPLAEDRPTWITAVHDGYAPANPVSFSAATTPADEDLELRLTRGATVIVEVSEQSGDAVPNVSVRREASVEDTTSRLVNPYEATGSSRKTDENGLATFTGLPAGVHFFRLEKVLGVGEQEDPDWKLVNVASDGEHRLSLTTGRFVRVAGVVRRDGVPLEWAEVLLVQEGERNRAWELRSFDGLESSGLIRRTDSNGRFAFELVDPGLYRLEVRPRATQMPVPHVRTLVVGDKDFEVVVDLSSCALRGHVIDESGLSLAGARVVLSQPDDLERAFAQLHYALHFAPDGSSSPAVAGVTTDREGRFTIHDLPVGTPLVALAIADGFYQSAPIRFELPAAGGEFDLRILLARAGSIEVSIRSESGVPIRQRGVNRAIARLEGSNGEEYEECAYPDDQGAAVFTVLRPGRWSVGLGAVLDLDLNVPFQIADIESGTVTKLVFYVR